MTFTTPDKPVDLAVLFPELAGLARTAVRLHPWQGEVTAQESSLGGPLLWPADEPWPVCTVDHDDPRPLASAEGREVQRRRDELGERLNELARAGEHAAVGPLYPEFQALEAEIREFRRAEYAENPAMALPMVAIAQFYARDLPELPFPEGTDVCQVLWCPIDHEPHYAPRPEVHWRTAATVSEVATAPEPNSELSDVCYLPAPCRITPDRVREFPELADLSSDELRERIEKWEKDQDWGYNENLSAAPGTKIGGWISWIQDPVWPECAQGHQMAHLLTVATAESGSRSWKTWLPVEALAWTKFEKRVRFALADGRTTSTSIGVNEQFDPTTFTMLGQSVVPESVEEEIIPVPDNEPGRLDLMLGDCGDVYLFVCPTCPDRPVAVEFQCG